MEIANIIHGHMTDIVIPSSAVEMKMVIITEFLHHLMTLAMNGKGKRMNGQMSIFDYTRQPFSIDNKIRLIELFAGYGSQAMALRNLGVDFETWKVVEFDKYAMASYNAVHGTNFDPTDISVVRGGDLNITDKTHYTYLMTYSFP